MFATPRADVHTSEYLLMAVTAPSCVFNSGLRNASGKTEQSLEHSLKQRSQYTTVYHSITQYISKHTSVQ